MPMYFDIITSTNKSTIITYRFPHSLDPSVLALVSLARLGCLRSLLVSAERIYHHDVVKRVLAFDDAPASAFAAAGGALFTKGE